MGPGDSNVADAEGIFTNSIHLDIEKCALCSAVKLSSGPKQPLTLAICIQDGSLHSKSLSFPCADVVLVGRAWAFGRFRVEILSDSGCFSLYRSSTQTSLWVHDQARLLQILMDFRYSTVLKIKDSCKGCL